MKILHITPSYKPAYGYGGTIVSVASLCEGLASSGIEVEVLTTKANGLLDLDVSNECQLIDGVQVTYLERLTGDHSHFSPALISVLWARLREQPEILVHIHSWWNLVSILSCLIAIIKGNTIILSPRGMLTDYTMHCRHPFLKNLMHNMFGRLLIGHCHAHATSKQEEVDILGLATPKSIKTIFNICQIPSGLRSPSPEGDKKKFFSILFLSRIDQKKGLEVLFLALKLLRFDWRLSIGGTGSEVYIEKLQNLAKKLEINHQIVWLGHVALHEKFELLAGHDLLVLFSKNENFANVVAESLAVGTPVAISKDVGVANVVELKDLGWICDATTDSIAATLTNSFQEGSKRRRIREMGPAMSRSLFSEQALISQYIAMYQSVL